MPDTTRRNYSDIEGIRESCGVKGSHFSLPEAGNLLYLLDMEIVDAFE